VPGEPVEYDSFLRGESVDLVVLNEQLARETNWFRWFNDEHNMRHMQKHYFPTSQDDQVEYFRNEIRGNPTRLQLGIVSKADGVLIGVISLSNIDFLNRKCEIGGLIGEKEYQTVKYWLEANRLLIGHAVDSLHMHRIYGGALAHEVELFYVRLLGFKSEGVLRQHVFKGGEFRDCYLFARVFDGESD
jgi:RimJ/RimL family protein N-acetyltransferase